MNITESQHTQALLGYLLDPHAPASADGDARAAAVFLADRAKAALGAGPTGAAVNAGWRNLLTGCSGCSTCQPADQGEPGEARASGHVNVMRLPDGTVRAVCEFCGAMAPAVRPTGRDGRLSLFDVDGGWSVAPYPEDFVHTDGSTGSQWTCPGCYTRLDRGESLYSRREPQGGAA